jgi:DNA-binding winged helix-turn-helix (wHTH) protein/TolB-like protein
MVSDVCYRFASFQLDANARRLVHQGKAVHLAPRDFALLEFLLENTGRVLDRETILKTVWHDRTVEDGNLTQSISILRHVLSADPSTIDCIETIPKHGYRFTLPVKRIERIRPSPRDHRVRLLRWVLASVIGIAAVVTSYWLGFSGWPEGYLAITKLGILPMQNQSGEARFGYACDTAPDDLAIALSAIPNLNIVFVKPSGSQQEEPRLFARRLALDAILSSSLERCAEALCITARLDHARAPSPLWTAREQILGEQFRPAVERLSNEASSAVGARVPKGKPR